MKGGQMTARFLREVRKEYPSFDRGTPNFVYRLVEPHLVQSISMGAEGAKGPGLFAPHAGWQFLFDEGTLVHSWARAFGTGEDLSYESLSRRTEEEFAESCARMWTWLRNDIMPWLDRLDSIEKLVAVYDAETDFTPLIAREEPSRFASDAGLNFGESPDWRRYNLGCSMAEVGRFEEAIKHLDALRRDYPPEPGLEWEEKRDARAAAKIADWRRQLSDSGA